MVRAGGKPRDVGDGPDQIPAAGPRGQTGVASRAVPGTGRIRAGSARHLANPVSSPRSLRADPPELMSHLQ
jgi:hypothetical protein